MVQNSKELKSGQEADARMTRSDLKGRKGLLDTIDSHVAIGGRTITYEGQDNGALLAIEDPKGKKHVKIAVGEEKEGITVHSVGPAKGDASVKAQ